MRALVRAFGQPLVALPPDVLPHGHAGLGVPRGPGIRFVGGVRAVLRVLLRGVLGLRGRRACRAHHRRCDGRPREPPVKRQPPRDTTHNMAQGVFELKKEEEEEEEEEEEAGVSGGQQTLHSSN